jgi:hypothetical protein
MTVTRLRGEMPNSEFVQWAVFYGRKAQRQEIESKKRKGG